MDLLVRTAVFLIVWEGAVEEGSGSMWGLCEAQGLLLPTEVMEDWEVVEEDGWPSIIRISLPLMSRRSPLPAELQTDKTARCSFSSLPPPKA